MYQYKNIFIQEKPYKTQNFTYKSDLNFLKTQIIQSGVKLYNELDPEEVDLIISYGGDGTVLAACRASLSNKEEPIPVFGINAGRVGYLTVDNLSYLSAPIILSNLLKGTKKQVSEKYNLLSLPIINFTINEKEKIKLNPNLGFVNDIVVKSFDSSLAFDLYIDDVLVVKEFIGDGILVSTQTGSTGYSLSSGGSILGTSNQKVLIITPINSHKLQVRPFVVDGNSKVKIVLNEKRSSVQKAYVYGDGQKLERVKDSIEIYMTDKECKLYQRKETRINSISKLLGWK